MQGSKMTQPYIICCFRSLGGGAGVHTIMQGPLDGRSPIQRPIY
jgi:hypothetical protein